MYKFQAKQSGFNLTELMIAMAMSLLLILGITTVFVSLKSTSTYSKQLENTQEVLRFTNSIFSRAIHHADVMDTDSDGNKQLDLTFKLANLDTNEIYTSCLGSDMSSQYYESYRLTNNDLYCAEYTDETLDETAKAYTAIGTNIDALSFSKSDNLLTVTITPADEDNAIDMIFAQRQVILGINQ